MMAFNLVAFGEATPAAKKVFIGRAEKVLLAARGEYQRQPTNSEAAWRFASACFERAEFAASDAERATLAVEGIDAMRTLTAREPKSAAGHFFLAMNLGQLARTKTLGALKIVDEMETEFKAAHALNERMEHAGPDRNLGLLYLEAPGWPASIGSKPKARRHLERAVELAPDFLENQLNLLDAHVRWADKKGLERSLKSLEAAWPTAETNFTGATWEAAWVDWHERKARLEPAARKILRLY
jgi:tetratricopeptide (TPR) repeat protein